MRFARSRTNYWAEAHCIFERHGVGRVGHGLEHGGEAEHLPVPGLIDQHLLLVFVHRRDAHRAGHDDVGLAVHIADLVDPLPGCEIARLHLGGQDRGFVVVQQLK